MTKQVDPELTDERQLLFDKASKIVARDMSDDPSRNDAADVALVRLIESYENLREVRDAYPPRTVKDCCNAFVLGMRYRTGLES